MNIVFITSGFLPVPPTKGGAVENLIFNLMKANEKQENNHLTVYSIYDKSKNKILKKTCVKYFKVPIWSKFLDLLVYCWAKFFLKKKHLITYRYFFQRLHFFKKVGYDLHKNNYDAVILENNVLMFRALELYNNFEKYKGKIFYHAHNELGKTLGYDKYLTKAKKLIGVSDYISNIYRLILEDSDTEIITIHNTVDESLFLKEVSSIEITHIRETLNINNGNITILFAGRICEEKGILELIKALGRLKEYNYNLVIVGNCFYKTNVKDHFEKLLRSECEKLKGKIVFTGYVPYKYMYKYYQLADLCVLPSTWNEPFGLTVVECISSGTPLITTPVGGIPENIGESTIMLDTEDLVSNIEKKLKYYFENKDALNELKNKARADRRIYRTLYEYYIEFINSLN